VVCSPLNVFRRLFRYHGDMDSACPMLDPASWLVAWMSTSAVSSLPDDGDIVCMQEASHGHPDTR
jgi:hypothetical protein